MSDRERNPWVQAAVQLALLGLSVWFMMPDHRRREMQMRAAARAEAHLVRVARANAQWAIRRELLTRSQQQPGYEIAHEVMTGPAAAMRRWYQRMRSSL